MSRFSRRRFIVATATAAAAAGGVYWWYGAARTAEGDFPNVLRVPGGDGVLGLLDVSGPLTIVAKTIRLPVLAGKPAPLLVYEVEHAGKTYFNPVLRVKKGATYAAKFRNALEEPSIIHWHGMLVDGSNDGHPRDAIPNGGTYQYRFQVMNRAGTYWYHPHPHGITGKQAHLGLAGVFIVEDDDETALQQALDLAPGVTDVPLVIQDKRFDANGALTYAPSDDDWFAGFLGDQVLVNLTARPHFNAATRIYRFRILNGSNARVYRLAFALGAVQLDYQVIGTDGGLLDRPYRVKEAFLSPGERLDVLLGTPITVKRGAVEIWELRNAKASMPHPMHVHGFHFRVLERSGSPEQVRRLALSDRGLAASDLGSKDGVLVWPGETVRVLVDFSHSFPGDQVYLVHCHNLEHEDQGMMLNFKVAA